MYKTRSSATTEGPRDTLCQLKSCQLLHSCTENRIFIRPKSCYSHGDHKSVIFFSRGLTLQTRFTVKNCHKNFSILHFQSRFWIIGELNDATTFFLSGLILMMLLVMIMMIMIMMTTTIIIIIIIIISRLLKKLTNATIIQIKKK